MKQLIRPETIQEREWALETFVRSLLDEYKAYHDDVCAYEAHLQRKVDTLERLADELAGRPHTPADEFDAEIPF